MLLDITVVVGVRCCVYLCYSFVETICSMVEAPVACANVLLASVGVGTLNLKIALCICSGFIFSEIVDNNM